MIDAAVNFLKDELSAFIGDNGESENSLNFIDLASDPPVFRSAINMLVINVEEEQQLRNPDRYTFRDEEGKHFKVQPPLRLNLNLLFACKVTKAGSKNYNYDVVLNKLSKVIQFFQAHPVFKSDAYPAMQEKNLETLVMEFQPLTYAQQNEIWSSLKTAYLPSVCYKMKMLIVQEPPSVLTSEIENVEKKLSMS